MLGVYLQPAIAGVDNVHFQAGLDLADLLGKLGGRGKDSGAASDFVGACDRQRRRLGFGFSCRLDLNCRGLGVLVDCRSGSHGFSSRRCLLRNVSGCGLLRRCGDRRWLGGVGNRLIAALTPE